MQLPLFAIPEDSDPHLRGLWIYLCHTYFPDRGDLEDYTVRWSSRAQKRTLASCNMRGKRINVARELQQSGFGALLEPLLYHEMCHAALNGAGGTPHGPAFKALERRHPLISSLNGWIKSGGWSRAVRSDRAKRAHQRRKAFTLRIGLND